MQHIATMRERGTLDTIECNSMLRLLTPSQKTQLETYFVRKRFQNNEIIWHENDPCTFAVIVHTGNLTYSESKRMYKRRGSGVHCDMNALYDEIRGENSFRSSFSHSRMPNRHSLPDIRFKPEDGTIDEILGSERGEVQEESEDLEYKVSKSIPSFSGTFMHLHETNNEYASSAVQQSKQPHFSSNNLSIQKSYVFKRGAFVGDVDGLFYNGQNRVGLRAIGEVTLLCLMKSDLQKFFKNNPGVLLSMLHTQFIT